MDLSQRLLFLFSLYTIFCGYLVIDVSALKCYVCKDCETYYNESSLIECKNPDERCLLMVLATGEVDRECGNKESCTKSEPPPVKPAKVKKREDLGSSVPKKRTVRQLLQQQLPEKDETKELPEFTSMHCCKEDECNSAFSMSKLKITTLTFLNVLFLKNILRHNTFCILLLICILSYTGL